MTLEDKVDKAGPRKLLALDDGGVRSVITLEILSKLEHLLRQSACSSKEYVLADYFDYIAGTGTGAIIATLLSLGMSVADIKQFYADNGAAMFDRISILHRLLKYRPDDEPLGKELKKIVGNWLGEQDATLASKALRTFLLIILRNASTDSPWFLTNNPKVKYIGHDHYDWNPRLPLWQLMRASIAIPAGFPAEKIVSGNSKVIFTDAKIIKYINPAFQLFLVTTLPPYRLEWPTGTDKILLVSVGAGSIASTNSQLYEAELEQDRQCRLFGECRHSSEISQDTKELQRSATSVQPENKLLSYIRYNADLSQAGLAAMGLSHIISAHTNQLDESKLLQDIGLIVAQQVKKVHFLGFDAIDEVIE